MKIKFKPMKNNVQSLSELDLVDKFHDEEDDIFGLSDNSMVNIMKMFNESFNMNSDNTKPENKPSEMDVLTSETIDFVADDEI